MELTETDFSQTMSELKTNSKHLKDDYANDDSELPESVSWFSTFISTLVIPQSHCAESVPERERM